MRDYIVNVLLVLCFVLGLAILVKANNDFNKSHKKECSTYTRHNLEYLDCRYVKKAGETK